MAFVAIPNNDQYEYDNAPPDPGVGHPMRALWLKSSNGIRTSHNHSVYVRCRRIGSGDVDHGELSKSYWDARGTEDDFSVYVVNSFEPDLVFDFKTPYYRTGGVDSTLSNSMTHTRTSNATMTDSDGTIKWAPHNLLSYSKDFSSWPTSPNVTITSNTIVAPDGTTTADSAVFDGDANARVEQHITQAGSRVFAVWMKVPSGTQEVWIGFTSGDLSLVTVTDQWVLYTYESANGNYPRINCRDIATVHLWGAHAYHSDMEMVNNPETGDSYVPTTSSAVYAPRVSHHIRDYDELVNTGLLFEGEDRTNLLTHSNDFTASSWAKDKVSAVSNYGVSPDGTSNADKIIPSSLTNTHFLVKIHTQVTPFNAWQSKHSFSVYVASAGYGYATVGLGNYSDDYYMVVIDLADGRKTATYSDFNASHAESTGAHDDKACIIEAVGSYYRVTISGYDARYYFIGASPTPTYVPAAFGLNSFTGDSTSGILVYGAQLERSTVPSSYIPTSGSQVTRARDTLIIPPAKLPFLPIILEEEMVTNGTSLTDTTGWTVGNNATLSVQDSKLIVTSGGGFSSHAYQEIPTVEGKSYVFSVDYEPYIGGQFSQAFIRLLDGTYPVAQVSATTSSGTFSKEFVAPSATIKVLLSSYNSSGSVGFNNISLKEVEYLDGMSFQMDGLALNSSKKSAMQLYSMHRDSSDSSENIEVKFSPYAFNDIASINRMRIEDRSGTGTTPRGFYPNIDIPYNILSPFSIASRHTDASMNSALNSELHSGVFTNRPLTTHQKGPVNFGDNFIGTISKFRLWDQDIGATGITKASKAIPSHPILMTVRVNAGDTFIAPTENDGLYDAVIDWGDGSGTSSEITEHFSRSDPAFPAHHEHTYEVAGDYPITITGTWTKIRCDITTSNAQKVLSVEQLGHTGLTDLSYAFRNCKYMTSFMLGKSDTSSVSNFSRMFYDCENLTSLDIADLDTISMSSISYMFFDCRSLTSIDVSGWDTSRITNMGSVFMQCYALTSLDVSNWDTSNVTSFNRTFRHATNLTTLDVSGWDTSEVRDFYEMFVYNYDLTTLDVSGWYTPEVRGGGLRSMFASCNSLTSLDVSNFDTSSVTDMYNMFNRCSSLTSLDLSSFDTSSVTDMSSMFFDCNSLTSLDLSSFDTSNVTNFTYMLRSLSSVTDIPGLENFNIQSVTASSRFFYFMESTPLPTSRYDALLINWEAQAPISGVSIAFGNSYLNSPKYTSGGAAETARNSLINTYGWTISDAGAVAPASFDMTVRTTSANEAFTIPCQNVGTFNATVDWGDGSSSTITAYNDADLAHTYATAGDHSISISGTFPNINFNNAGDCLKVIAVTNLGQVGWLSFIDAFYGCQNITSFTPGVTDTSSVTTMFGMFSICVGITSLDVSSFDTSSVTDMTYMFSGMPGLQSLNVSSFDTSSVTNMNSMFQGHTNLTSLDVSNFDTSSVTDMGYMFEFLGMSNNAANVDIIGVENFDIEALNSTNDLSNFMSSVTLPTSRYDALLVNWDAQDPFDNMTPNFGSSRYTAGGTAATARANLISTDGWTISDGGSV